MDTILKYPATSALVLITVLISWKGFQDRIFFTKLKHWPHQEKRYREWYRFISSGFLHGSWLHLIVNMFVLFTFGGFVEESYVALFGKVPGLVLFLLMYILTIIAGDLPTYIKHKDNPHFSSIGASGAVSGILFIYVLFRPWSKLYIYGLLPIYAIIGAFLYLAYSSWASRNQRDLIDHDAHFYGALFGVLFTLMCSPRLGSFFLQQLIEGFPW